MSSSEPTAAPRPLVAISPVLVVLVLLTAVSNLLVLVGPIFMLQVYDRVLSSRSVPTLVALTALVVVLYGFAATIDLIRSRIAARIAALTHRSLSELAFRHAIHPTNMRSDEIRDADTLRNFLGGAGPLSLMDLPWLPIYLALIFVLHPILGWLAIGGSLIMIALLIANELSSRRVAKEISAVALDRSHKTEEATINREVVAAMGMTEAVAGRWRAISDRLLLAQTSASDHAAFFGAFGKSFRMLLQSGVLAAGAYLVIIGQLSPGLMLAASVITARALAPVEQVVAHWKSFVAARQAIARMRKWPERTQAARTILPRPTQSLTASDLWVTAPGSDRPLIGNINLALEASECLVILGLSGSGKSSLARALVGVWPTLKGEIRLDGAELGQYGAEAGEAIGYLPQEVELFDGTIADNIARLTQNYETAEVLLAATSSGTNRLITHLPDGYDTRIGPRGTALSAGQRQRIGLARALYGNPFLLVLDEPNSNLDAEGEAALMAAVQDAKARGAIVVIISHRSSIVTGADKLLYVAEGRQVAFGSRDEVLDLINRRRPASTIAEVSRFA
jgi:ATP-binding cassette subfamily C protein PrsD